MKCFIWKLYCRKQAPIIRKDAHLKNSLAKLPVELCNTALHNTSIMRSGITWHYMNRSGQTLFVSNIVITNKFSLNFPFFNDHESVLWEAVYREKKVLLENMKIMHETFSPCISHWRGITHWSPMLAARLLQRMPQFSTIQDRSLPPHKKVSFWKL